MPKLRAKYVREYFWQTRIRKLMGWILQIGIAVLLALFCAFSFGQRIVVSEGSMEPTLESGDKVFMNTLIYRIKSPARGDLIVFETGEDSNSGLQVKRVIGLPGESIQIKDGNILINGEIYIEDRFGTISNPGVAGEPVKLEKDEYFVLGDNRENSEDSRHLDIGLIERDRIVGKLWLRYGPFERFGFVG